MLEVVFTLPFTVDIMETLVWCGGELALCGEDRRGSAGGQEMVGSDRRGEGVSTPVGNPPSRRDPELGSPSRGVWGGRVLGSTGQGSVMVPQR